MKPKRVLFFVMLIPLVLIALIWAVVQVVFYTLAGLYAVLGVLCTRLECWSLDVPRGRFYNCPWKRPLGEVFMAGYKGEQ